MTKLWTKALRLLRSTINRNKPLKETLQRVEPRLPRRGLQTTYVKPKRQPYFWEVPKWDQFTPEQLEAILGDDPSNFIGLDLEPPKRKR